MWVPSSTLISRNELSQEPLIWDHPTAWYLLYTDGSFSASLPCFDSAGAEEPCQVVDTMLFGAFRHQNHEPNLYFVKYPTSGTYYGNTKWPKVHPQPGMVERFRCYWHSYSHGHALHGAVSAELLGQLLSFTTIKRGLEKWTFITVTKEKFCESRNNNPRLCR